MRWFILYGKGLPLLALAWAMMAVQGEKYRKDRRDSGWEEAQIDIGLEVENAFEQGRRQGWREAEAKAEAS